MLRFKLHFKVLLAFLALALVPLAFLTYDSVSNLRRAEQFLTANTTEALDRQASETLRLRAETVAEAVGDFLREVEGDFLDLSRLPRSAEIWRAFLDEHRREVWYREGTNANWNEVRENLPLYTEIAFVDTTGRERIRVLSGGREVPLRDVSVPFNTTFKSEDYFHRSLELQAGELYISPVTGWYVTRHEQLQGASNSYEAVEGRKFEGVVRIASPVFDRRGLRSGVLVLSLDHRHLMEFTQHLTPEAEHFTVFPSYASGNYAFMFDHEGWMIAHPKFWDIRGLDQDGRQVPAYTSKTPEERIEAGVVPFNLRFAGFIHPNYPMVADAVLRGESGVVDVTNVGGSHKIMAYAPIVYRGGPFRESGIFGGITIGAELSQFHEPAVRTSQIIRQEINRFINRSSILITLTVLMVFMGAFLLSHGITRPLKKLTLGTREMARGNLTTRVAVSSHDEIGDLTNSFNAMADELNARRQRLLRTLQALRRSRHEILNERNFKQTVVEHIETGLLTLDAHSMVTYANGPAQRILGIEEIEHPQELERLLHRWPEFTARLASVIPLPGGSRWSDYISVEREGHLTYRLSVLPLDASGSQHLVSIEDLTERVQMREKMARMDRLASLGRMAAGIAHEVRNPLTGINLLLDELHDRLLNSTHDQALIRQALGEIERLEQLVSGLLDFSLRDRSEMRPLKIADILHETLVLFRRQCEKEGVELTLDIARDLPAVKGDAGKLKQAFFNLLANGLEAIRGEGSLHVSVSAAESELSIIFRDSGEGIAPEQLPLIFEPFYTSKDAGSGLGLSITHNIISEHGGRIEVESRPGEGSRFEVILPSGGEN